jgi:hypothetical protein
MFLRHLRRTRAILQVVDGSTTDAAMDYWAVREELRMYNPQYCARPHVVVLNKVDLMEGQVAVTEVMRTITENAVRFQAEYSGKLGSSRDDGVAWEGDEPSLPVAVVCVSALHGVGLSELSKAIHRVLAGDRGLAHELQSTAAAAPAWLGQHNATDVAGLVDVGQEVAPVVGATFTHAPAADDESFMRVTAGQHKADWDVGDELEEMDEAGQLDDADLQCVRQTSLLWSWIKGSSVVATGPIM